MWIGADNITTGMPLNSNATENFLVQSQECHSIRTRWEIFRDKPKMDTRDLRISYSFLIYTLLGIPIENKSCNLSIHSTVLIVKKNK